MEQLKQQFEYLVNNIMEIRGTELWNEKIELFKESLEIITNIRKSNICAEDNIILRKLTEELIKVGIDKPVTDIKSYKRNRLFNLTLNAKQELEKIPYVEEPKVEINNINDWIKSLQIFKLNYDHLSQSYYKTSYDLYQDIRKIVLTKTSSDYKRIYAVEVIKKLEIGESKLPDSINLKISDYELNELIKLIKNNQEFNYSLMKNKITKILIVERFEREELKNKMLLLIKK